MPPKKKNDNSKVEVEPSDGPAPDVETDEVPDGHVKVVLSQHWTDPATGKNWLPGSTLVVTEDTARGLDGAGYASRTVVNPPDKLEITYVTADEVEVGHEDAGQDVGQADEPKATDQP